METKNVKAAEGKLGVLVVGLGAVSTTFITGVLMTRKGLAKPIGSMTQYDKIRVGRGENKQYKHYGEIVPLTDLNDIVFGTWDAYPDNAYEAAINAEVLKEKDINPVKDELEGENIMKGATRKEMIENLRKDISDFKKNNNCARIVVIWAASTEIYVPYYSPVHDSLADLEKAIEANDKEHIAPSMCYAYAALKEDAPFIMGAPNKPKYPLPAKTSKQDKRL